MKGANFTDEQIAPFLRECLGHANQRELEWICDCVSSAMKKYKEVEVGRRFLRMPLALAEGNLYLHADGSNAIPGGIVDERSIAE